MGNFNQSGEIVSDLQERKEFLLKHGRQLLAFIEDALALTQLVNPHLHEAKQILNFSSRVSAWVEVADKVSHIPVIRSMQLRLQKEVQAADIALLDIQKWQYYAESLKSAQSALTMQLRILEKQSPVEVMHVYVDTMLAFNRWAECIPDEPEMADLKGVWKGSELQDTNEGEVASDSVADVNPVETYSRLFKDHAANARFHFLPLLATILGDNFESLQAYFSKHYGYKGWVDMQYRYKRLLPLVDDDQNFTKEYLSLVSKTARKLIAVAEGRLKPYHLMAADFLVPLFRALSPERRDELIALWRSWGLDLEGNESPAEEEGPVIITT